MKLNSLASNQSHNRMSLIDICRLGQELACAGILLLAVSIVSRGRNIASNY